MSRKVIKEFKGKYRLLSNFYPGDKHSLEYKYQASKLIRLTNKRGV